MEGGGGWRVRRGGYPERDHHEAALAEARVSVKVQEQVEVWILNNWGGLGWGVWGVGRCEEKKKKVHGS